MNNGPLFETPEVVKRQGEELFLKCPLYRTQSQLRPIYINKELFRRTIADIDASWEEMSRILGELFSATLNFEESSGEQVGWAYVDRQADPLNLSLSGNEGSGRAYYTGTHFNIKGEKTPLATSAKLHHSNGVLAMQDGIWSTLIANSLYPEKKVTPVLAILDLDEVYTYPNRPKEVHRVKIIRLDMDGSLDRITHLFYLKKALTEAELFNMATRFGQLDAFKFMQRILHGSWSNGNISPQGHLIDYDSVCAVKGRQAQFSQSSRYIDNYFSFEYLGKLKVLESLMNEPQNKSQLRLEALQSELNRARKKAIAEQFLSLMGFNSDWYSAFSSELHALSEQFIKLSAYIRYQQERSFYTNIPLHFFAHLFDFSTFFRYFPLLKLKQNFNLDTGLALLVDSELIPEDETLNFMGEFTEEPLDPKVLTHLQAHLVSNEAQVIEITKEAYLFMHAFDCLFEALLDRTGTSIFECAKQAYLINEDRFYLFPVFDLSKKISKIALTQPEEANKLIEQIINACKRPAVQADLRLFIEGRSYIEFLDEAHFQIIFELKQQNFGQELTELSLSFNDKQYKASSRLQSEDTIRIESNPIELQELLIPCPRDEVFQIGKYQLFAQNKRVHLHDYFNVDPRLEYYL